MGKYWKARPCSRGRRYSTPSVVSWSPPDPRNREAPAYRVSDPAIRCGSGPFVADLGTLTSLRHPKLLALLGRLPQRAWPVRDLSELARIERSSAPSLP